MRETASRSTRIVLRARWRETVSRDPCPPVIQVEGLRKHYVGRRWSDVSFDVQEGEIFGLIGPNGAGKTTTLECVEGLRKPDAGRVRVFGLDPLRDAGALQPRVGVQLQESHLQKRITVWEAIDLWSSLYRQPVDGARLLEQLGLQDKRQAWFMTLSGGQKQRLFIALALIHDPEIVFLDELTNRTSACPVAPSGTGAGSDRVKTWCDHDPQEEAERLALASPSSITVPSSSRTPDSSCAALPSDRSITTATRGLALLSACGRCLTATRPRPLLVPAASLVPGRCSGLARALA